MVHAWTRRTALTAGLGGLAVLAAGGAAGLELVKRGVLPGAQELDRLDGACTVAATRLSFGPAGPSRSGTFKSRARNGPVGYTIGFPPGYSAGQRLPLIVMLHGAGGTHKTALTSMSPAQAMALRVDGQPLPPMAMVTADGGDDYWNPHPGDDPMAMIVSELIPMCQRLGLGRPPERIGVMGISMGGYGAVLLAELHPRLFAAVAAISPAIWTSYRQTRAVSRQAYATAADFTADDTVTHTAALAGKPVRIASGESDPFHPGVAALARALPASAVVHFAKGCHTGAFFAEQEPPSLAFLASHLTA
jgi:enterochelin esterase-like enzyme